MYYGEKTAVKQQVFTITLFSEHVELRRSHAERERERVSELELPISCF